jgi:asparagine synthase (glutamine-hydrolysing)
MSFFAGIYSIDKVDLVKERSLDCKEIIGNISRRNDSPYTYSTPGFFIAYVNIGAYDDRGYVLDPGVCFLNGRCYYSDVDGVGVSSRDQDMLTAIDKIKQRREVEFFRDCRGTFSLCFYDKTSHRLLLGTDRWGTRPIYIHFDGERIYFASALRILESITGIHRTCNISHVFEKAVFGCNFSDHTSYDNIFVLRNGELFASEERNMCRRKYFDWNCISPTDIPPDDWTSKAFDLFSESISIRARDMQRPLAMLSGGLDSRCIVTALTGLGYRPDTLTFATNGRIDDKIARRYSESLGLLNHFVDKPYTQPKLEALHETAKLMDSGGELEFASRRVFTGDGGSVGVGFVYVEKDLVELAERKDFSALADRLLGNRVSRYVLRSDIYQSVKKSLLDSILGELEVIKVSDPVRLIHYFYMNTDQRCHLHWFYEDLDLFRMEFELPFMDSRFCEFIFSIPGEHFLFHNFYHRWVQEFPKEFMSIAWQTYPRHLSCPISSEDDMPNQWNKKVRNDFVLGDPACDLAISNLSKNPMARTVCRTSFLSLAIILHRCRFRAYGYIFNTFNMLSKFLSKSHDKVVK